MARRSLLSFRCSSRMLSAAALIAVAFTVGACSAGGSSEPRTSTITVRPSEQPGESAPSASAVDPSEGVAQDAQPAPSGEGSLAEAYGRILDNPRSVNFNYDYSLRTSRASGSYQYALADITGDNSPELLLCDCNYDVSPVVVINGAANPANPVVSEDVLIRGAAGAGGGRYGLSVGNGGIYQIEWHSLRPESYATKFGMQGSQLVKTAEQVEIQNPSELGVTAANFVDVSDRSVLSNAGLGAASAGPAQTAANTATAQESQPQGENVLSGTIKQMTAREVMKGQPTPNGESPDLTLWVLVLDSPQSLTGRSVGDRGAIKTRPNQEMVSLDNHGEWSGYKDQHVNLTYDPTQSWWPSDASLPLGKLRAYPVDVSVG